MPTPSEPIRNSERPVPNEEWAARPRTAPASIFGNYPSDERPAFKRETAPPGMASDSVAPGLPSCNSGPRLRDAIDTAIARSFVYRLLAQAYEDPTKRGWEALSTTDCKESLSAAVRVLAGAAPSLVESAREFEFHLCPKSYESFHNAYLAAFGHAARGRCPLNEIEYGDIKADPLFQPHRLADLAAFYRAFGLEIGDGADERHDHICIELEFMCVLAAKEAYALEHQLDDENLETCCNAQKRFLREHLGRWAPACTRRLARMAGAGPLAMLATLTRAFIEAECSRFQFAPGSEDLLLRPVNEAAESLCSSCGLGQRLPGSSPPHGPN